jgi:hypothetical protein
MPQERYESAGGPPRHPQTHGRERRSKQVATAVQVPADAVLLGRQTLQIESIPARALGVQRLVDSCSLTAPAGVDQCVAQLATQLRVRVPVQGAQSLLIQTGRSLERQGAIGILRGPGVVTTRPLRLIRGVEVNGDRLGIGTPRQFQRQRDSLVMAAALRLRQARRDRLADAVVERLHVIIQAGAGTAHQVGRAQLRNGVGSERRGPDRVADDSPPRGTARDGDSLQQSSCLLSQAPSPLP